MILPLRVWRAINIVILAVAILAPWGAPASDLGPPTIHEISGWDDTFDLTGFMLQETIAPSPGAGYTRLLLFAVGSLSLIAYTISSLVWFVKSISGRSSKNWRGALWITILVSSLLLLRLYSPCFSRDLFGDIGWVVLAGCLASRWKLSKQFS